jgi:hypothetical protein
MPEVERHPRQSIGGLWGVALFLSLPLRFQPQLHHAGVCAKATREARMRAHFPQGRELFFKQIRRPPQCRRVRHFLDRNCWLFDLLLGLGFLGRHRRPRGLPREPLPVS